MKFSILALILFAGLITLASNKLIMVNKFVTILILMGLSACAGVSTSPTLKLPNTSPSRVVSDYLEALKKRDFERAYSFISIGYAGNFDREGYKINMKQDLDKLHWSLLGYQVLGAQIFGDQALVAAELEVKFKPINLEKETQKKIKVQYGLTILDNKWKISSDKCIFNCITQGDFTGQGG